MGGERGGGRCLYLDLHLDLQVSPIDGEQCAVRAGGAQLPGAVWHVPVAVSQEDQRGGGDLAGEGALLCRGGEGRGTAFHLHTHSHLTHTLCQWCELMFHSHCTSTPWTIGIPTPTPPTHLHSHSSITPYPPMLTSTPFQAPPTHVNVHPQYTAGGPVLVQWVPTSHFGLRVEQEVVRKPEDQQWITVTANNGSKHIPCTIQHIQTNTVLVHTMCAVLRAKHGLQYEDTAYTHTLLTHHSTTHISTAAGRDVDGWSCCVPRCLWRLPLPCHSPLQLLLSVGCG